MFSQVQRGIPVRADDISRETKLSIIITYLLFLPVLPCDQRCPSIDLSISVVANLNAPGNIQLVNGSDVGRGLGKSKA